MKKKNVALTGLGVAATAAAGYAAYKNRDKIKSGIEKVQNKVKEKKNKKETEVKDAE